MRRPLLLAIALAAAVPGTASAGEFAGGASTFRFGSGIFVATDSPTARVVAQRRSAVRVSGEMVVTYAGDPATCAAVGRCDVRGTMTWRPPRGQNLYLVELADRGKRSVQASLFPEHFADVETVSQVRRARSAGGTALCSDARSSSSGLDAVVVGTQLVLGVRPEGPGPLDSRCAGPLWQDLRYVLPRPRLELAALRERGGAADLRTEQTFVAAGLRGTVRSTLVASLARPQKVPLDRQAGRDDDAEPRVQRWRVARLEGSVRVDVRGSSVPARCEPLDACGLVGSVTLTPKPELRRSDVFTALYDEPEEDGSRFGGGGGWVDEGTATATFTRPDAPAACLDAVSLQAGSLFLAESGGRVAVSYDPVPGVRTRCPGPAVGSVFEFGSATATVPLRRFRARRVRIRLTRGVARTVEGYRVTSRPDLTLELVRR